MTVKELIEKLQGFDPELTVTVDGYEGGVTEKLDIGVINVWVNRNTDWWYGEHELVYNINDNKAPTTKSVLNIGR